MKRESGYNFAARQITIAYSSSYSWYQNKIWAGCITYTWMKNIVIAVKISLIKEVHSTTAKQKTIECLSSPPSFNLLRRFVVRWLSKKMCSKSHNSLVNLMVPSIAGATFNFNLVYSEMQSLVAKLCHKAKCFFFGQWWKTINWSIGTYTAHNAPLYYDDDTVATYFYSLSWKPL